MAAAPDGGERFAALLEPGLGKTMIAICNAAYLSRKGKVQGMLVLAPRGAHTNWVKDELPKHMPIPYQATLWDSGKWGTSAFAKELDFLLHGPNSFAVFALNIDALRLPHARKIIKEFVQSRPCVGVLDESADIASPSSERGRMARILAKLLPYRRILDGTPWAESPFELYGQFKFLGKDILGDTYADFKSQYGDWVQVALKQPREGKGGRVRTHFPVLKGYRNLDKLARRIAPYSVRYTRAEVAPELPKADYSTWYFKLSPEQQTVYDNIRHEYLHEFGGGREVEAAHVLTRMLRLQQVAAGYVPVKTYAESIEYEDLNGDRESYRAIPESEEPVQLIEPNARMAAMLACVSHYRRLPMIIWHRFQYDRERLVVELGKIGLRTAVYAGSDTHRDGAKRAFQDGHVDIFLADPTSGGRALTLTRAHVMIFYTHYFGLRKRLQAEDRFQRLGLDHNILVVDLVAQDTVDEKIVASHRAKKSLSDSMGQMVQAESWL